MVLCPCPSREQAEAIAQTLVQERLAACVQLLGSAILSIYRWEGTLQKEPEQLLLIKTTAAAWPALAARLDELHPYDVPEILAIPAEASEAYAAWLARECRPAKES